MTEGTYIYPTGEKVVTLDYSDQEFCPFTVCGRLLAHRHPVCPTCRAIRYGNLECETCHTLAIKHIDVGNLSITVP